MKIEHVALYVNDLEKAKQFFCHYLNGKAGEKYHNPRTHFQSYFISFEDGARLELMHKPQVEDAPKSKERTGYAHIAFSVGSKEKVDALTQQFEQEGYAVLSGPRTTGDGYYESVIVAIEENWIEITV